MGIMHCFQTSYLHAITRRLFMAKTTPSHIADDVAEVMINSNLAGHDSHGIRFLPSYLERIDDGVIVPTAEPEVAKETRNTLTFDGNHGFGHYVMLRAMERAIEKASQADVCCVSFIRTGHIGRLGQYAELIAQAGYIGLLSLGGGGGGGGMVVPFGGAGGMLGTNPIAVGIPTGDDVPFIIDFATSMIAGAKIAVAESIGADLPPGCIVDKHGNPSISPADFADGGFLMPFGRHKGYALCLLTCLLGGLSGNFDLERGTMNGLFMQVINVSAFTPLQMYQRGVRAFLDGIKETPSAPGFDEVLVPGDFEHRSRVHRLAHGIEVPDTIYQEIQEWADRLGVSLGEEIVTAADIERYQICD